MTSSVTPSREVVEPPLAFAEDLAPHDTYLLGPYTVSRDEIVEFARLWDPQAFHVDDAAAAAGTFGEVVASGAHTFAILQRLSVDAAYRGWAVVAGRAVRDLELPLPVRAGDTLTGTLQVLSVRPHKAGVAFVEVRALLRNSDAVVMAGVIECYVRERANDPARAARS